MTSKKLILHIGMDKTGTSAIQFFLHKNRKILLDDHGILYPKTGLWSDFSHHPFAFAAMDGLEMSPQFSGTKLKKFTSTKLYKLFHSLESECKKSSTVIISSECLFKCLTKDGSGEFIKLVKRSFDLVTVVVYVRRQDEWIISRHKHSVLSGHEISCDQLAKPFFCNYKEYIDLWASVFGANNIVVRPYEKSQFFGNSIYSDFMSLVEINSLSKFQLPSNKLNTSLGVMELCFKQQCNEVEFPDKLTNGLNEYLIDRSANGKISHNRLPKILTNIERVQILNKYAEVNSKIAKTYMGRKDGVLFKETIASSGDMEVKLNKSDLYMSIIINHMKEFRPNLYKNLVINIDKKSESNLVAREFSKLLL